MASEEKNLKKIIGITNRLDSMDIELKEAFDNVKIDVNNLQNRLDKTIDEGNAIIKNFAMAHKTIASLVKGNRRRIAAGMIITGIVIWCINKELETMNARIAALEENEEKEE